MKLFTKKNAAVIITGGSSGIGKCFVEHVLNLDQNFPICNLSRSKPEGLRESEFFIHCPCDLAASLPDSKTLEIVNKFIDSLPSDGEIVLVNNSGVGAYGSFEEIDIEQQTRMIQLNVTSLVSLTGHILPRMLERGGTVINIASTAAFQPTPNLGTYGATKSFVLNWSLALNEDLRKTKVKALCVCPGPTSTNFFKAAGFSKSPLPKSIGETSEQVVETTLKAWAKGKSVVVSGWSNKLLVCLVSLLPKSWVTPLSGAILRSIRKSK